MNEIDMPPWQKLHLVKKRFPIETKKLDEGVALEYVICAEDKSLEGVVKKKLLGDYLSIKETRSFLFSVNTKPEVQE